MSQITRRLAVVPLVSLAMTALVAAPADAERDRKQLKASSVAVTTTYAAPAVPDRAQKPFGAGDGRKVH
jgi:hypothetical protein